MENTIEKRRWPKHLGGERWLARKEKKRIFLINNRYQHRFIYMNMHEWMMKMMVKFVNCLLSFSFWLAVNQRLDALSLSFLKGVLIFLFRFQSTMIIFGFLVRFQDKFYYYKVNSTTTTSYWINQPVSCDCYVTAKLCFAN